ncbi:MAG: hypothetical protein F2521_04485 [Actinobacteria bacterium]|uniref:Unannotated protein n=1 Tax=freshwater metagenome TaxID=449393 RepID=A0A6J6BEY9_9ZZZZ|nr:hypothetical protein [Actinomycetota bacterium]
MKGSKSLIAISIAVSLALIPSAIAAPKTTVKAAGPLVTKVVNTILNGVGVPSKKLGINGDFYIDTKSLVLYGPKINGAWKNSTSLKQAEVKSVTTVIGEAGAIGDKGATGNTGATGSVGLTGAAGIKGLDGAKGSTGLTGATGSTGLTGATGLAGAAGIKGDAGTAGAAGAAGVAGASGAAGVKGDTGLTGSAGATGSKGDTGLTGSAGADGVAGGQGAKGDPGAPGTAGISISKFASLPNIALATATSGNSTSEIFFTADSDGDYTFEILVSGGVQAAVEYKLNAEIVVGTTPIASQFAVASDVITYANRLAGRQYGFHIIGAAAGVTAGTIFAIRISIQIGAGTSTVYFTGRALINKVGSIG